ncbi:MAG: DUF2254 domain-containing protein [Chitinophagaceae bacterium]|nr:MAG: DUF2254 domain-containing protein [Chitinophagaceae bacterium]
MQASFFQWLIGRSKRMVNSIAFYPALIAAVFVGLSILMISIDYSSFGTNIKSTWKMLRLRDASTARSIISAIAAGLISLTVFSFSMVMIVLNQAASQMSNRILDKLIGNRFQQVVLGFYIGTIVYSLFLLSTIRDIDAGIYVPSLSTYLLILLTVGDIFLFIYFLHYITQSVKYEIIISRIHTQTKKALQHTCRLDAIGEEAKSFQGQLLFTPVSGIFSGFNRDGLLSVLQEHKARLSLFHPLGKYLLEGIPFGELVTDSPQPEKNLAKAIFLHLFITKEESIDDNFVYGMRQLTEVALRALSPGINDPGTAINSLHSLADLLAFRLKHHPATTAYDEKGNLRLTTVEPTIEQLFDQVVLPIWDYGKKDRLLQQEMHAVLLQLQQVAPHPAICNILLAVEKQASFRMIQNA